MTAAAGLGAVVVVVDVMTAEDAMTVVDVTTVVDVMNVEVTRAGVTPAIVVVVGEEAIRAVIVVALRAGVARGAVVEEVMAEAEMIPGGGDELDAKCGVYAQESTGLPDD